MRTIYLSAILVLAVLSARAEKRDTPRAGQAGDFNPVKLTSDNLAREYRLIVPKSVDLSKPAPLLVAFHGMLIDSKDVMPLYTKLNEAAAKYQYVVAFPNALNGSWGLTPETVARDLKFYDALVKEIKDKYEIDENRIYVCGMSNGGYFAHLTAQQRSDKVAAVAGHSAALGLQTLFGVHAKRKFPVLIIHGDKDRIIGIDIARENRDKYKREGHEVVYVELPGEGHMWGKDSNARMFEFFAEHPLKAGN